MVAGGGDGTRRSGMNTPSPPRPDENLKRAEFSWVTGFRGRAEEHGDGEHGGKRPRVAPGQAPAAACHTPHVAGTGAREGSARAHLGGGKHRHGEARLVRWRARGPGPRAAAGRGRAVREPRAASQGSRAGGGAPPQSSLMASNPSSPIFPPATRRRLRPTSCSPRFPPARRPRLTAPWDWGRPRDRAVASALASPIGRWTWTLSSRRAAPTPPVSGRAAAWTVAAWHSAVVMAVLGGARRRGQRCPRTREAGRRLAAGAASPRGLLPLPRAPPRPPTRGTPPPPP